MPHEKLATHPRKIREPDSQTPGVSCSHECLDEHQLQAYDFGALGKHEGNSGFEDERPAAYLCFGTLHAPHCATQVFVFLPRDPSLSPTSQKARPHRAFWQHSHAKSATRTSGKIRDPINQNPRT